MASRWRVPLSALRSFPRVNLTNLQPLPGSRPKVIEIDRQLATTFVSGYDVSTDGY